MRLYGLDLLTTSYCLTTTLTQSVSNKLTVEKIRMQYAKSYVESMSDEELELALNKLNLIEENSIENDVKII